FNLPPPPFSTLLPYTPLFRSRRLLTPALRPECAHRPRGGRRGVGAVHEPDALHRTARQLARRRRHRLLRRVHRGGDRVLGPRDLDRKSTRLNSSHVSISYAVF